MDEAEQQYKRGLALREAGDIDGCIAALQAASQAPRLRFATASLLARIFRDRGMTPSGRRMVRAGRPGAGARPPEEGHDLLYDLADALEKEGETARALAISLELQADAGDYPRRGRAHRSPDQGSGAEDSILIRRLAYVAFFLEVGLLLSFCRGPTSGSTTTSPRGRWSVRL